MVAVVVVKVEEVEFVEVDVVAVVSKVDVDVEKCLIDTNHDFRPKACLALTLASDESESRRVDASERQDTFLLPAVRPNYIYVAVLCTIEPI